MDTATWIEPLERRYSHWAIPHLVQGMLALMTLVYVLSTYDQVFVHLLMLNPVAVMAGEIWRLFTFLVIPEDGDFFRMIFYLWFTWSVSSELEHEWGAFKINLYFLVSALCVIIIAFLPLIPFLGEWLPFLPFVPGHYILSSIPIVYGTVFPRSPIGLFPLPFTFEARFLAMIFALFIGFDFVFDAPYRLVILASYAGYFSFFLPVMWSNWQMRRDSERRMKRFRGE